MGAHIAIFAALAVVSKSGDFSPLRFLGVLMDGDFLFSIISVVKNDLPGLISTKASIDLQNDRHWEWIVVDGMSNDGSAAQILELAAPAIKVLSEADRGIYNAMNKGLAMASGDYLVFLNAGDSFASADVLEKVRVGILESRADVFFGSSLMRFNSRDVFRKVRAPNYIWHGQPGLHQATFYRRSCHTAHRYSEQYKVCGDYDALARMWKAGHRFVSKDVLISINDFRGSSTSGERKCELIIEAAQIQRRVLHLNPALVAISVLQRTVMSIAARAL